MDVLSGFLDGPRAAGAFLLRSLLEPPWSLRIQDEAPLTIVALVRGEAWIGFDGDEPQRLGSGDVAIVRGPDPYTVAHRPGATPDVVIHPGQVCATPDGHELHDVMALGVRTWGNDPDGSVVMLTGTYTTDGEVSRRLLDALPPLTVLTAAGWHHPAVALLTEEIVRDEPGQEAVLDRLLDLVLVAALRADLLGRRRVGAGLVPGERRPGGRSRAPPDARGPCRAVDGRDARRARPVCPGPRSPGASTSWSASPR